MVLKIAETGIRAISTVIPRCPDGMLTPEQSVKLYKDNGYHFLCFSSMTYLQTIGSSSTQNNLS